MNYCYVRVNKIKPKQTNKKWTNKQNEQTKQNTNQPNYFGLAVWSNEDAWILCRIDKSPIYVSYLKIFVPYVTFAYNPQNALLDIVTLLEDSSNTAWGKAATS